MSERYPELEGKVVLVTGGSRGIGEQTVRDFAAQGASVVFNYNTNAERADRIVADLGPDRAVGFAADLSRLEDVIGLWQRAVDWSTDGVDVVVHNAAVRRQVSSDVGPEEYDRIWVEALRVNLVAPAHLSRLAVAHFIEREVQGVIIGMTGRIAVRGDYPDYLQDGAAKGGLNSLLRGIARGYAKERVLTYLVSAGLIVTDQLKQQIVGNEGDAHRFLHEIPIGEPGTPQDISEIILFLATGRARYSTGSTMTATGGSFLY